MWIEEELQKDATETQETIHALTRDYRSRHTASPRTRIPENKEKTTEFLKQFYDRLRNAEYNIYQKMMPYNNDTGSSSSSASPRLSFQLTEVKNSATDLPHPRILSELRRAYDIRRSRRGGAAGDGDGEDDRYIPYKVYEYIREKSEYCIRFQADIHGRAISLFFITFPESHISVCQKHGRQRGDTHASANVCASEIAVYQLYAYKVFIWLSIVTGLADKECSENGLNVYFYMTPFKKQRPAPHASGDDAVISAIHANTGLTRNCETHGEIVVYRTEEWFKVFIHESMHNFNMDFIDLDLKSANEQLRRTFCIPHDDILLFETYTETWARIINTIFNTYLQGDTAATTTTTTTTTRTHFIRAVREKLTDNAMFYAYQAIKVLDIMGLKYAHITVQSAENTEVCRKQYTEDTNVYAYYILGGILSVYALPFISWCCENNSGASIRFSRNDRNLPRFVDFIERAARDPVMLSIISFIENASSSSSGRINKVVKNTMRMTME
jgi:hypothetical protein